MFRLFSPSKILMITSIGLLQSCSGAEMAGGSAVAKKPSGIKTENDDPGTRFQCVDAATLIGAGQTIGINVVGTTASTTVAVQGGGGTAALTNNVVTYTAPSEVTSPQDVTVVLTKGTATAQCKVKLMTGSSVRPPDNISPLSVDDGVTKALVANVYKLQPKSTMMPILDGLSPEPGIFMSPNVNVPYRTWTMGFPELQPTSNFVVDFAIRFYGNITVETDGSYQFRFDQLDDGAILSIDDQKVIDANGLADPKVSRNLTSQPVTLTKGSHKFKVDYFQGPANKLGVVLSWSTPGGSGFTPIPATVFSRP